MFFGLTIVWLKVNEIISLLFCKYVYVIAELSSFNLLCLYTNKKEIHALVQMFCLNVWDSWFILSCDENVKILNVKSYLEKLWHNSRISRIFLLLEI